MLALLARHLLDATDGRGAAYPSGALTVRKFTDVQPGDETCNARVMLVAVSGIQFYPEFIWLRDEPERRFFALLFPGWSELVEAGCEAQAPRLLELQAAARDELLRTLAEQLTHRVEGLLVIRDVRVFDAEHARLSNPSDVYVHAGRIAAVRPAGSKQTASATVIDGRGRTLLPGLFDMHAHEWRMERDAAHRRRRDHGARHGQRQRDPAQADRLASSRGRQLGPRIVPAGFIEGESPHSARNGIVVASRWTARSPRSTGTRSTATARSSSTTRCVPSGCGRWRRMPMRAGLRVSGHIPAFMRAEEAVRAGYDEIQHINQVMLNFLVGPKDDTRTLLRFTLVGDKAHAIDLDGPAVRRFIALLRARGTTVDPTAAVFEAIFPQRSGRPEPELRRWSPTTCRRRCSAPGASTRRT